LQQLEEVARRRGWRLAFRDVPWGTMRCRLRVLDIFKGPDRVWGAASSYRDSDDPNFPSQKCAEMILSQLPGRGVEHGKVDDQRIFSSAGRR
jgi:hypothetical protein